MTWTIITGMAVLQLAGFAAFLGMLRVGRRREAGVDPGGLPPLGEGRSTRTGTGVSSRAAAATF
jgi:hypothetical protein